uniref:Uncharacterized protein n=1 Tax=Timema monikensis TaxID=170555 RepID=A0A7R9E700_9NEOP|nr:unnamed protein product [Timema monikensis]
MGMQRSQKFNPNGTDRLALARLVFSGENNNFYCDAMGCDASRSEPVKIADAIVCRSFKPWLQPEIFFQDVTNG